jgi:hypothetical protein
MRFFRGVEIYRSDFPLAYHMAEFGGGPHLRYLIKKRHTFDILHNHQMLGHAVVSTMVARWLGKKNIIKVACAGTFGDLEVFPGFPMPGGACRCCAMADAIAVSREIQDELLQPWL